MRSLLTLAPRAPVVYLGAVRGLALALALLIATDLACGYRFVRRTADGGDVRTLAVRTPRNDSYEAGIELMVAEALRREVLRSGALTLTERPGAADVVLSGSVQPIRTARSAVSSVVLALEYQVTLRLALEAVHRDGTAFRLDPRALVESERYLASADVEATRKNREEALRRLSHVLAARVVDSMLEAWVR